MQDSEAVRANTTLYIMNMRTFDDNQLFYK